MQLVQLLLKFSHSVSSLFLPPIFFVNPTIIEWHYFPMPAFLSPPLVDASQLFLQRRPPHDNGEGAAAKLLDGA